MTDDQILTTQEAAEILGIARESVSRLLKKGTLKGKKLGNAWAVYSDSVYEYQEATAGKGKTDPTR